LGAASLQAQAPDPSGKPWSVSAKVRGFYDDNYNTAPSSAPAGYATKQSSWGIDFAPSISYDLLRAQTSLNLRYDFDLRWYEARAENEIDYTHHGQVGFSHAFNDRLKLEANDSLVYASEPSVIEPTQAATYRSQNDAWRNYGGVALNSKFNEKLGSRIGYSNSTYDYIEQGAGSRSALLDRMEHLATVDLRYQFQPTLVGLAGYQFGYIGYSSTDPLYIPALVGLPAGTVAPTGEYRDQQSNYGFLGADYTANPRLNFQLRAGANYATYPNANSDDILAPYVDFAASYEYLQGSRFALGIKHDLRPTDVATPDVSDPTGQSVTVAQEATTIYALISHKLTEKLRGNLRGSWQNGQYQGGAYDGQNDNFYTVDVSLEYAICRNCSIETGYAFDKLDSDINYRGFDRNRFFFGLRASY
jgi:hypothetical protein